MMGPCECQEPVNFEFLSLKGSGNESACDIKEKTVDSMAIPAKKCAEKCYQQSLCTITHQTLMATSVAN